MTAANQGAERRRLGAIFRAAVAAVDPGALVERSVVSESGRTAILSKTGRALALVRGRVWLVAAGKAAPAMSKAACEALGTRLSGGIVAGTTKATGLPSAIESFAAGHPVPDRASLEAGRAAWRMLAEARPGDVVLVLLSGGASSLLVLPASGITLEDKVRTTELLLRSGASIAEVNAVRKHLSRLKGGGLALRAGEASVVALLLSDVIGGAPSVVGSGPTAADPTTFADAWRVLVRHGLADRVPPRVRDRLDRGRSGALPETPKPGSVRARNSIVGDNRLALGRAAEVARELGLEPRILTHRLRGDTGRAAEWFAERIRSVGRTRRPVCLLAGGETTVEVRGSGEGGRNQEFALHLVDRLAGLEGAVCLSAGSDGIDGPTAAAGAFVDWRTHARAKRLSLAAADFLARNDSREFFARLGDLFQPGPTGTNVMDLKIAVVLPQVSEGNAAC